MKKSAPPIAMMRYDYVIQVLLTPLLLDGWRMRLQREPAPGDLVLLNAAPRSEWHLSIYREKCAEKDPYGGDQHLFESLKTGKLCRWGSVSINVLDAEKSGAVHRMTWTDDQFEFEKRFNRVCKRGDFYMAIPYIEGFDGKFVHIKFRTRHSFDKKRTALDPIEWKSVTQRDLLAFLKAGEAKHNEKSEAV